MSTPTTLLFRPSPLFKPNGERLRWSYVVALQLLGWLQRLLAWWELRLEPLLASVFQRRGMSYHVLPVINIEDNKRADEFLTSVKGIFETAKEIRAALGEMGSGLMEHPKVLKGLRIAAQNNNATIHFVHGPRVDPKTQSVFTFAQEGMLTIFKMPEYVEHHFWIITSVTGDITVIDEGVHNESVWAINRSGEKNSPYYSRVRHIVVMRNPGRLAPNLLDIHNRREEASRAVYKNPELAQLQNYSLWRIAYDSLRTPLKRQRQLLGLLSNRQLELSPEIMYPDNGVSKNGKGPQRAKLKHMSVAEREHRQRFIEIPLNTTLDDIPEPDKELTCVLCGHQLEKAPVQYTCGSKILFRVAEAPGYRCTYEPCSGEYISTEAVIEALTRARDMMLKTGELDAAREFMEAIARTEEGR